ncbi:hypothetical protein [Nonomuraea cavernae]|uniref:hypothetical protein n=1 Tax=Nonomuraea cavernae TaxID=2045107 RepID=UPI0033EDE486
MNIRIRWLWSSGDRLRTGTDACLFNAPATSRVTSSRSKSPIGSSMSRRHAPRAGTISRRPTTGSATNGSGAPPSAS